MKLFTRYLLRAHLGPFLFAFVALTGVILINTLAKELASLAGKGLPLSVVLEFFLLSLPANIALTLPMAVLVAVLYTFSTLAAENEITALRAGGVDLRRVVLPLLGFATVLAGAMVWFNNEVLPAANYRWRMLMTDVAQTRSLLFLQPQTLNPIPGSNGTTPYYLEAQELDPETGFMRNVSIYDVSTNGLTRTIDADSGHMAFNPDRTDLLLTLFDGEMREISFDELEAFQKVSFARQVMRMEDVSGQLERTADSGYRTSRDMTLGMMLDRMDSLRTELVRLRETAAGEDLADGADTLGGAALGKDTAAAGNVEEAAGGIVGQIAAVDDAISTTGSVSAATADSAKAAADLARPTTVATPSDSALVAETRRYAEARARNIEYQLREYQVEIHKKFAIASATLVFVLIGVPLALRFPRGGIGMVIAVSLSVFGIYYVGLIGGEALGDEGYVPAAMAMWGTNAIFGVLGVIGFLRLGREQGTSRGGGWGELPHWLRPSTYIRRRSRR